MQWSRNRVFQLISFVGLSVFVTYAVYWWFFIRIPRDWEVYTNWEGYPYSFAHPKEWIVSNCGNGEVVVAKKPMEKCYYPLDAPEEYLENLYFQVFLPKRHFTVSVHTGFDIPNKLEGWTSITWVWRENVITGSGRYCRYGDTSIPVPPIATASYTLFSRWTPLATDAAIAYPMNWFEVGFISKPSYIKELEKVFSRFTFSEREGQSN